MPRLETALLYYRSSSDGAVGIAVAMILLVVLIVVLSVAFSKARRLKRKLRNAPKFPIAQLPEDTLGRVIGRAQATQHTLVGPLTGRPCVYYIATVEEHRSTGRSSYWKTIISESAGVPFMIEDGTGRALIDPSGAQVALDFDGKSSSGTFRDADPVQEAFLAKHGQKSTGWVFNKGLRFREAMIEIGETIAVLGSGVREPDPAAAPEAAYRGAPPTRLRLTSSTRFPLVISDDPSVTQ
jgi:hypothetical protein